MWVGVQGTWNEPPRCGRPCGSGRSSQGSKACVSQWKELMCVGPGWGVAGARGAAGVPASVGRRWECTGGAHVEGLGKHVTIDAPLRGQVRRVHRTGGVGGNCQTACWTADSIPSLVPSQHTQCAAATLPRSNRRPHAPHGMPLKPLTGWCPWIPFFAILQVLPPAVHAHSGGLEERGGMWHRHRRRCVIVAFRAGRGNLVPDFLEAATQD